MIHEFASRGEPEGDMVDVPRAKVLIFRGTHLARQPGRSSPS